MQARAIEVYREGFKKAGGNVDAQVRALYGIQQAQLEAGLLADAVETGNRLVVLEPINETWIIPHAWFRLGQTNAKLGKAADARAAFERVGEYDEYEFQERLEGQVREEMRKLEQGKY